MKMHQILGNCQKLGEKIQKSSGSISEIWRKTPKMQKSGGKISEIDENPGSIRNKGKK
jgi:hypothetical protein